MTRSLVSRLLLFFFAAFLPTAAFAVPNVVPFVHTTSVLSDRTMKARAVIVSNGTEVARDVVLRVTFPDGLTLLHATPPYGWGFKHEPGTNVAEIWSIGLDPEQSDFLDMEFRVEETFWGQIQLSATSTANDAITLTARSPVVMADRLLRVTSGNDAGPGSLRDTIETVNQACDGSYPCHVIADAGLPAIVVESPMPPIEAIRTVFDGPFELDGHRLEQGNGIELRAAYIGERLLLNGMRVRNFPGNGFEIAAGWDRPVSYFLIQCQSQRNTRGISFMDPHATTRLDYSDVSANERSGIVVNAGKSVTLARSEIVGNGASGIFVAGGDDVYIHGNTITDHPDFGIAILRGQPVRMSVSSMKRNGALDVDFGLDGPTPNDDDESDGLLNAPVLTDAVFDPARWRTIVKGHLRSSAVMGPNFNVQLFAGTAINPFGIAHAEIRTASTQVATGRMGGPFTVEFTIELEGDVRGRFLSAQTYAYQFGGSEAGKTYVSEIAGALPVRTLIR